MRPLWIAAGILTLCAVWLAPLREIVPGPFSAHMVMHMGVVALAAPLLAVGVAGRRFDPVPGAPRLFVPIPVSLVELVVVWAWHTPLLHHAARHSASGLFVEQAAFLLSGTWVWVAALGGAPGRRANQTAAGVLALLLTSMHMTLLGALLALSPRPLFHHPGASAGLSPLDDQHLGGAIMLLAGGVSYLTGGLALSLRLLRRHGGAPPLDTPAAWPAPAVPRPSATRIVRP
jgi:putative membrane protein